MFISSESFWGRWKNQYTPTRNRSNYVPKWHGLNDCRWCWFRLATIFRFVKLFIYFQPTFITFGEYPVDTIFVNEMLRSQDLLNFLRLLQEVYPDSWQNRYSCLSENDRCPKRPDYTCGRCLYRSCVRIIRINLDFHFYNFRERSLDGTCNNQHHPTMGASFTPYLRTFSSYFADGKLEA